jgi:hypothetical protein
MKLLSCKIKRPWLAFVIIFIMAAVLSKYGTVNGSLMIFDILVGIFIYKSLSF